MDPGDHSLCCLDPLLFRKALTMEDGVPFLLIHTLARYFFDIYIYPSFRRPSLMILVSFSVSKHSSRFQTLVLLCFCESENGGGHFHDSVLIFCFDIYMVMIKKKTENTRNGPTALTRSLKHQASKGV